MNTKQEAKEQLIQFLSSFPGLDEVMVAQITREH